MDNRVLWRAILIIAVPFFPGFNVCSEEIETAEIIVTASRNDPTAQPVRVVETEEIVAPLLVVDILRGMPGLAVSRSGNRGALTQVRLRGAEANHVLVLIDGVQADDPATGSGFDFGTLTHAGVRAISIASGPQDGLRGTDALAGIIRVDTTPRIGQASVHVGLGTEQSVDAYADFARVNPLGHLRLTASRSASAGTNASFTGNENDPFDTRLININGRRTIGNVAFTATSRATRSEVDFDPSPFPNFVPVDGNRRSDNQNTLISVSSQWMGSKSWSPIIQLSSSRSNTTQIADGIDIESSLGTRRALAVSNTFHIGSQQLSFRAAHQVESVSRRGPPTDFGDPNVDQTTRSSNIAAHYLYRWKKILTSAVIRYDHNSAFKNAATFAASASLETGRTSFFSRFASGIKNPSFVERFGYTPDTFIGNPNLKPESSNEFQVGARHSLRLLDLSVVYFEARLNNEIDGFLYDPIKRGFTARNVVGRSDRSGTEIALKIREGSHSLDASYSLIGSNEGGRREIRRPRSIGQIFYAFEVNNRWGLATGFTHTGSQIDTDFSTYPGTRRRLDSYRLINVGATFQANASLRLQLFVENVFNTKSQDVFGYRNPGRSIRGAIRATL